MGLAADLSEQQRAQVTEFAKSEALRLGFSLVGVTTPAPVPHLEVYQEWIAEGRHGEMGYLETDRALRWRADPKEILPECQSILVLAANYLPEHESADGVAAYAVGDDYHEVLVNRLKELVVSLERYLGGPIKNRYYTDTGPLLERELAQRAGLGWIGKNTCLIHPAYGSYFFLAELLIELPLIPDSPFETDQCGSCTLCIEACPTDCILPNRTLDASRCISYLTIELDGVIPEELRPLTDNWVFGCDVCQDVCPWNVRFSRPSPDPSFQPRSFLKDPQLEDFLALTPEVYRDQLKGSPLKRAKRGGLLRNAALAAANSRSEQAVPALRAILTNEPDATARLHAAWALGEFGEMEILEHALAHETEPSVRQEIQAAINRLGGKPGRGA